MAELLKYNKWRLLIESKVRDEDLDHYIAYYPDGMINWEGWYRNEMRHREDEPASIWYYPDGKIEWIEYFRDGEFHREDGPARIKYYPDGMINWERWYIDGIEVTGQELEIMKAKVKYEKSMREMGLKELL
jgi:antitoxin component YwqK of YwqJK toxin-antitoxin module